jgi:anti-sigma factor RsiW
VARLRQRHLDDEFEQHLTLRAEAHLDDCRHCGLEAATYERIKQPVRRRGQPVPPESVERLSTFAEGLLEHAEHGTPLDRQRRR